MKVILADICFELAPKYDYMERFMKNYIVPDEQKADERFPVISVTDDEINREKDPDIEYPLSYLETLAVLRKIAEYIAPFGIILFHGVAFTYDNKCYIITAKSGTGKSTHVLLWQKYLGETVKIINGDKPLIKVNDNITVYGTPWCGKEGIEINTSESLDGIIFLDRGEKNEVSRISESEAVMRLLGQVHMTDGYATSVLAACDRIIRNIPVWNLKCDISEEAVAVCFEAITGKEYKS